MSPVNLNLRNKTRKIQIFISEELFIVLRKNWDIVKFPHTAKTKRDPKYPLKKIPFSDMSDYVRHLIRKESLKSNDESDFDSSRFNPDHPDFDGVVK